MKMKRYYLKNLVNIRRLMREGKIIEAYEELGFVLEDMEKSEIGNKEEEVDLSVSSQMGIEQGPIKRNLDSPSENFSETNTCDKCKEVENTDDLIWITAEDFKPRENEKVPKELYKKYDALCESCYSEEITEKKTIKEQVLEKIAKKYPKLIGCGWRDMIETDEGIKERLCGIKNGYCNFCRGKIEAIDLAEQLTRKECDEEWADKASDFTMDFADNKVKEMIERIEKTLIEIEVAYGLKCRICHSEMKQKINALHATSSEGFTYHCNKAKAKYIGGNEEEREHFSKSKVLVNPRDRDRVEWCVDLIRDNMKKEEAK